MRILFTEKGSGALSETEFNCIPYYATLKQYVQLLEEGYYRAENLEAVSLVLEEVRVKVEQYNTLILKYIDLYSIERLGRCP